MPDIVLPDPLDVSYSTRSCDRCDLPMSVHRDRRGRVWQCAHCGRKTR